MMHTEFDSHCMWPNSNNESSSNLANPANMRQSTQNNNSFKVAREETQGIPRYAPFPNLASIYSSPTITTESSQHGTMNHQYSVQGPHQISQPWPAFYQNSNSFGSSLTNQIPWQVPVQTQSTKLHYYKLPQSWPNNQNVCYKNQNVSYPQYCISNDNLKTSDCSNKTEVDKNLIPKTPRIRVRDVNSVNNTVCQGLNTNLCEPQINEPLNLLPNHKRAENNVLQRPYANIDMSACNNLNNKHCEYYELLINNQAIPVSINNPHQKNIAKNSTWVSEVNLKTNKKNNDILLPAGAPDQRKTIGLKKLISKNVKNVAASKRVKISARRRQPGDVCNVNTQNFLRGQSNLLKSGFQDTGSNFNVASTLSVPTDPHNILNTQTPKQNQRIQATEIFRTECDSSTLLPCNVPANLSFADKQHATTISSNGNKIISYTNSDGKNKSNLFTTKANPQSSSAINDTNMTDCALDGMTNVQNNVPEIHGILKELSLLADKKNKSKKTEVLPECSKSGCSKFQERNDSSDNQQVGNKNFSTGEIFKKALSDTKSSVMMGSVKTDAKEIFDSNQKCSKSSEDVNSPVRKSSGEDYPVNIEESISFIKSKPVTEPPTCTSEKKHSQKPSNDLTLNGKKYVTSGNEISTREESSPVEHNYESKINREKLNQLKEFLEGGDYSKGHNTEVNDSLTKIVGSVKRKREDDALNHNRRKLSKSSVVKNKNKTREMISLVSYKLSRNELKCDTNSVSEPFCKENSDEVEKRDESEIKNKEDEDTKDKTDEIVCLEVKKESEKLESETKDQKKLTLGRNSSKENFEIKRKRQNENGDKSSTTVESDKRNDIEKNVEETTIVNTMKAFQKMQYYYCMSCEMNSSNDSFWVNVVSGELRCLNCFKKMAIRAEKTALKSKNVLENSIYEPKIPDNIHKSHNEIQRADNKREEKNDSSDKTKTESKDTTIKILKKQIKNQFESTEEGNVEKKKKKKKKKNKNKDKDNHQMNSCSKDNTKGNNKLTCHQNFPLSDMHIKEKKIKKEISCLENSKSSSNLNVTLNKNQIKSNKEKRKKDESEREVGKSDREIGIKIHKKEILLNGKKMEKKDKKKFKQCKISLERSKLEVNSNWKLKEKESTEKLKKKSSGDKKREKKFRKEERNEDVRVSKNQSDLLEKLYEKTKELSWVLLAES